MRLQAHLLSFVLIAVSAAGVTACEKVTSTTVARSIEDGDRVEKDWVRTWKDRARFECVASTSGACQVVVFVSGGDAEERHDLIADRLIDETSVLAHHVNGCVAEAPDDALRVGWRHLIDERGIVRHDAHEDCGAAALGRRHPPGVIEWHDGRVAGVRRKGYEFRRQHRH
jgi:hypothetical protein